MPFLGRDWRSPGDEWIKVSGGNWETVKVSRMQMVGMLNHHLKMSQYRRGLASSRSRNSKSESEKDDLDDLSHYMPHIIVKTSTTRENALVTTIRDALVRLDMHVAIEDTRRFAYVCKILLILIGDKFHHLSGSAQLCIMGLLRCVFDHVRKTCNNVKMLRDLLAALRMNLTENKYEHVGSSNLWSKHLESLVDMETRMKDIKFEQFSFQTSPESIDIPRKSRNSVHFASSVESQDSIHSNSPKLSDLPSPCLINIMSKLSTLEDLHNAAVAHPVLAGLTHDPQLWQTLIGQHFTGAQLRSVLNSGQCSNSLDDCNWPFLYKRLLKRFGGGDFYACQLHHCDTCAAVFWPVYGHPCTASEEKNVKDGRVLSPEDFVKLFKI